MAPVCDAHNAPALATPRFVDATNAWGLGKMGVAAVGNRIISADLDGDGFPDLIVHAIDSNARQTIGTGPKLVNVFMNRPNPAGGRMFVDATQSSGVFQTRDGSTTQFRSAQLAVAGDIDNDGDLDLFSGTYTDPTNPKTDPGDRSEILLNDGHGVFTLAPPSAPHPAATDLFPTTGGTFLDADRDGKLDLFVGFWYASYGASEIGVQAQLYKGAGDGSFTLATDSAGLTTVDSDVGLEMGTNSRPAYGVTSCDLDGDGAPELMVSAYGRQWNLLYQNDGYGKFTEVGQASGYAGDANLNYKDNQFFVCYCTLHMADAPDCAGVGKPRIVCPTPADSYWSPGSDDQPWRLNGNTFSTLCDDLDGDGTPDLYSAEIKHWHIGQSADGSELLHSTTTPGKIGFMRPGNATTGLTVPHLSSDWNEGGIHVAAGDFDGDGREDLILGTSDYPDQFGWVYHQKPDGTFEEVGKQWGFHHACVSGLTVADFDRDGDLDVVVGSGTARDCSKVWTTNEVHFYENKGASQKWLLVRLQGDGTTSNKEGIGAKVTVKASGQTFVKELTGGYGHMAMGNDAGTLYFGLGDCAEVDSVSVRWPDKAGTTEVFPLVMTNQFIELHRGDPKVHTVKPSP